MAKKLSAEGIVISIRPEKKEEARKFFEADGVPSKEQKVMESMRIWVRRHPITVIAAIFLFMIIFAVAIQVSSPPPSPPPETFTAGGFWNFFWYELKMPAVFWAVIIVFFWLTKW